MRHVYAFCYICQPCQTNLNDARPKFGMVAPEFVRFLRRGIYFRQAGLLSLPESLAGVRLGRSKASKISTIGTILVGTYSAYYISNSLTNLFSQEIVDVGVGLRYPYVDTIK